MAPRISVVVPVYNSRATLAELVGRLRGAALAPDGEWELVLVNDSSPDGSWDEIARLAAEFPEIRGIDLMRNSGQHAAVLAGIRAARAPVVVTLDDDLQHPPEEIPKLLAELERGGHDVVYGPPERERHGAARDLASRLTKLALQSAMGVENARNVSAFRAFRTGLRDGFAEFRGPFVSIDVLLSWSTRRYGAVPVRHEARKVGRSGYNFFRLATHALNMITGFSAVPLQLASFLGFGFALFGVAVLVYVVGRYLVQGAAVPGFAFLASIIALFSGANLLALGIIGEYIARIHARSSDRPIYTVRQTAGADPSEAGHPPAKDDPA